VDTYFSAQCAKESTMARRRQVRYSPEFKAETIRLVRNTTDSITTIARDVGISEPTLRAWIASSRPFAEVPLSTDERTELGQLRREVRQLREERDILKKATAFFAKQSD
jgi:transposase